ncbi:Rab proteins geranylgeranyltransferase component A 2 [Schistosoma japonicum]|nr:Rab proteins geranylgeranyltransferase component A 2 [Schistosoma japonicum]
MDFPEQVDCVIDGTGLSESLISASLSILGKHVLHIDRNDYYGGVLASLRFPEFEKFLNETDSDCSTRVISINEKCLDLNGIGSSVVTHRSSDWFLDDSCDKSSDSNDDNVENCNSVDKTIIHDLPSSAALTSDIVTQQDHVAAEFSSVNHQLACEQERSSENKHENIATTIEQKSSDGAEIVQSKSASSWSRSKLQNAIRLHDIDIVPKILYSHSPTVAALLRADVTRYLEFRFVSRLLAYVSDNCCTPDSGSSSSDSSNQPSSTKCTGRVVKIPVCRSDVFKTRLLSLHQKRSLGAFFEWCFHLIINDAQGNIMNSEQDEDYRAYEDRPFQELLSEKRKLDKFTQQLLITNLSFSNQQIKTKEAIFRIRRLLFSMGRFGPYPILWPMYGSGDLTQGYCRMSAVFGATFCLSCKVEKIEHVDSEVISITQSVENISTNVTGQQTTETNPSSSESVSFRSISGADNRSNDLNVYLSNGRQVKTKCVILCPECLPYSWISDYIKQWCARAVLITDSSLLPDDCQSSDISILAYSNENNGHQDNTSCIDPILIIECQVEKNKPCEDLFVVHLCAVIKQPSDPKKIFQPVLNCLFTQYDTTCIQPSTNDHQSKHRPKMLWAGYFCVPDLSTIPPKLTTKFGKSDTLLNSNIFVTSGPDAGPDLDSTIPNAEKIFRDVITILGLPNNPQNLRSTADVSKCDDDITQTSNTSRKYATIDSIWDGQFPPKAPQQEDIIVVDDSVNPPPVVTIEAPGEDQN